MISTFLSLLTGVIIVFPFIIMILFLVINRRLGKSPSILIGRAADVTTPFLFLSVYVISHTTFGDGVGFYITIVALIITIIYAVIERKRVKEFRIMRLLRKVWRLLFIVLAIAYLVLLAVGMMLKVWEYVK